MEYVLVSMAVGLVALVFAAWTARRVLAYDAGSPEMQRISAAIQQGAQAFLGREYWTLLVFAILVTAILAFVVNWQTALCFVVGAGCSAATGYAGMAIALRANVRTAAGAMLGLNAGLRVAFSSGVVMGMAVVGLGVVGLGAMYFTFFGHPDRTQIVAGFSFGASSIALFARVGGGIYTKAADVGADLVGKVEQGIPEDDPRNPAVIADNVGDNVGDVAGMGADLFESYVGSIVGTMALATVAMGVTGEILPLLVAAVGILSSIVGTFFVRVSESADFNGLLWALRRGILISGAFVLVSSYALITYVGMPIGIFVSVVVGLMAGITIGFGTEYFTSYSYRPTREIAEASQTGAATTIIRGLAVGLQSTVLGSIVMALTVILAYQAGGLYGVALAGVGMLSTLGITLATDAYGPVADNAGGIAEMAHLPDHVRERTDALDSLGNTTAATGKGFAIGSAVVTALALMVAYAQATGLTSINLLSPMVIAGLLLGATLPFVFASMAMEAVGKAAFEVVNEVRRQFREIKGIMSGEAEPNYAACVDITTAAALREMIIPGTIAVVSPVVVGLLLGKESLGGLLLGSILSGFLLAIMMANSGGAWDNAKKFIEAGQHGGKGSEAHKAAVVGDTVGDPFKDTAGPSLNILIKLMSIVALVFAPLFTR